MNLTNRPSIIWDLITKNKKMDNFKVSDEQFIALVTSYTLEDGTVTLDQLKEAAANTRAPEVVLNNFKLYDLVYGSTSSPTNTEDVGAKDFLPVQEPEETPVAEVAPTNPLPTRLSAMNKTQLTQVCVDLSIELDGTETKQQIIDKILPQVNS